MKSEMIRVSTDFAENLRRENEKMNKALYTAGKKKRVGLVQFTKICKVNTPSIVVPDLIHGGKRKPRIEEEFNIFKLI